ncbi:MAG TPA: ATP synthase F1 subunit delta [Candidatus Eisenbacteria bacterium]|nr:ATP synthase F1 subunit delta [Candidatus Eisenbacteria bacterium]
MTGGLGRRYAQALIGLARDGGTLVTAGEELARAAATFATPELRNVVINPGVAAVRRRAVVDATVTKLGVSTIVGNLIRLLGDRDRLAVLDDVARAYDALVDRELGRARVKIRSVTKLTDVQIAELEQLARRLTGKSQIVVSTEIDPALIGGVVLDASGTVYDGSVKTQLARLAGSMAGEGA